MALKIRMSRGGSKKRPYYKIVVTDSRNARDGKFIEKVGSHNPFLPQEHPERVAVNVERVKYWLSVGAKSSDRLNSYFSKLGLETAYERYEQTKKSQPKAKAQERLKAEIDRKEAAEKAAQEAAAAPAPVQEIVAEVPVEVIEEIPSVESVEEQSPEETIVFEEASIANEEAESVSEIADMVDAVETEGTTPSVENNTSDTDDSTDMEQPSSEV